MAHPLNFQVQNSSGSTIIDLQNSDTSESNLPAGNYTVYVTAVDTSNSGYLFTATTIGVDGDSDCCYFDSALYASNSNQRKADLVVYGSSDCTCKLAMSVGDLPPSPPAGSYKLKMSVDSSDMPSQTYLMTKWSGSSYLIYTQSDTYSGERTNIGASDSLPYALEFYYPDSSGYYGMEITGSCTLSYCGMATGSTGYTYKDSTTSSGFKYYSGKSKRLGCYLTFTRPDNSSSFECKFKPKHCSSGVNTDGTCSGESSSSQCKCSTYYCSKACCEEAGGQWKGGSGTSASSCALR